MALKESARDLLRQLRRMHAGSVYLPYWYKRQILTLKAPRIPHVLFSGSWDGRMRV
jgi:hypothetical protein